MDMVDWLLGKAPQNDERRTTVLSWLAGGMVLVALVLFALAQALRLPADFGMQDWLGWKTPEALQATLAAWRGEGGPSRIPAATANLLIDTALFMPLYGLTLLWATRQVRNGLQDGGPVHWLVDALYRWMAAPVLVLLWVADAAENMGGLARLGIPFGWGFVALAAAALAFWLLRRWATSEVPAFVENDGGDGVRTAGLAWGLGAIAWMVASLLAASLAAYLLEPGAPAAVADGVFAKAHGLKQALLGLALVPLLLLWLCWWFGLDLDSRPKTVKPRELAAAAGGGGLGGSADEGGGGSGGGNGHGPAGPGHPGGPRPPNPGEIRSACRQVAMGVIGRTRYVLAVLAVFGVFTLGLDQCRDVLLALVTADHGAWWVVLIVSALGLAMLSHACWLWARLVGRIKRSGYVVLGMPGNTAVGDWAGQWARTWARLLMLAPLLMTTALIANVAGDAVIAVSVSKQERVLPYAEIKLAVFAVVILALALWLLMQRSKGSLKSLADYYNSVDRVRPLVHDPYCGATPNKAAHATSLPMRALGLLAKPVWQPLVALGLLLAARAFMLLWPETAGAAPPTLAVVSLSLVWWLGPLGVIAMSEQRAVIPWALLLMAAAGFVSLWSDNHTLPGLVINDMALLPSILEKLRGVALGGVALLALVGAALWLTLALRSRQLLGQRFHARLGAKAHTGADLLRLLLLAVALVVLAIGMWWLDHWAAASVKEAPGSPPILEAVKAPAPKRLLLVASEGGGVRAAYWTARVLAEVETQNPNWSDDLVALSGVSGGSMGFAVWRACARNGQTGRAMLDCLDEGFANLDSLSPLVAGLLFEDVWMRLLPTDKLCGRDTGCGMRSRAMGFEREWMRGFPRLAERLAPKDGEETAPYLMLNSTVAESGNRGVLATARFKSGELPGAEDLIGSGRLSGPPALVTAAHTSARFPFVNPLASLPLPEAGTPADGASAPPLAAAHLVDGGYHDNSGAASLSDVLPRLRKKYGDLPMQLVLIRNGQVPTACLPHALKQQHGEPGAMCLIKNEPDACSLLPPRDAQRLGLYADLVGPLVAVINNVGTAAQGREPLAALTARMVGDEPLRPDMGCTATSPVCLLDQVHDASLVPLGWTLSPAARQAMDVRAVELAQRVKAQLHPAQPAASASGASPVCSAR